MSSAVRRQRCWAAGTIYLGENRRNNLHTLILQHFIGTGSVRNAVRATTSQVFAMPPKPSLILTHQVRRHRRQEASIF
jgi:hypothetical protein